MSLPQLSDKDVEGFFAARSDPLFESFFDSNLPFDFGLLPESFESSGSSASAETRLFDSLSTVSSSTSFGLNEVSPSSAFDLVLRPADDLHKGVQPRNPANDASRSRKLVHQFRPDGRGISGSELLSIEGQSQPMSIVASAHGDFGEGPAPSQCALPSTPPITPNLQCARRRTSTSPIRKPRAAAKRSKSHSTKVAAAIAVSQSSAPEVPPLPHANARMHSQTMLQTAGHERAVDVRHKPTRLPLSPPSSSRFPPYDFNSTLSASNHDVGGLRSESSVQSTSMFQHHGIDSTNYAVPAGNAFSPAIGGDLAALSSQWPTSQPPSESRYPMHPWEAMRTPVFDHSAAIYDLPAFSANESNHPYFFDASLASSGLMIQHAGDSSGYSGLDSSTTFNYPSQYPSDPPSPGQPPSMSPSMPLHPEKRSAEKEPPPITLPKRGSASSGSRARRTATKHSQEPSRSNTAVKSSSSPAAGTLRNRTAQHTASQSTGSIRSPSMAGSIRARKSTGSLANAAGHKAAGSRGHASKSSDKIVDADSSGMPGFVNFTPNDSRKILTGVAPSGSSKTKARREREAVERRRRLSEAAAKAVRAVGGDLEGLVRDGVFEEELMGWDEDH